MTNNLALGIVIGGVVGASLGRAFDDVRSRVSGLQRQAGQARLWQNTIGETQRLQQEYRRLHLAGDSAADGVRRRLDSNLRALREQGIEVGRLERSYRQLGRTAERLELRARGHERIGEGIEQRNAALGDVAKLGAAVAIPVKVSADYQAIIRDIAIKSGTAGTDSERHMSRSIAGSAVDNGIERNILADAINQMVGGGMEVGRAVDFAPLVAKFSVGQNATAPETAKMISALEQNAKITDPQQMMKALESIAYLGKAGSFESADMARWFPELLAEMQNLGLKGQDSVTQLGAMLQVQMKTAGSSDQAANNLKNWLSKIGAEDTKSKYEAAGIDYEAKMREAIGKGWSSFESSFVLARSYIEKTDPQRAKALSEAAGRINAESDPEKQKAMMRAFDDAMKTGDLFADMQAKAALTAYMQNAELYAKLKRESAKASGEIERDLADRRASSKQLWSEVMHSFDEAMNSIGDAIRPVTDVAARSLRMIGDGVAHVTNAAPGAVGAVMLVAGAFSAFRLAKSGVAILRGVFDLLRSVGGAGQRSGRRGGGAEGLADAARRAVGVLPGVGGVQSVFVTNWPAGYGGGGGGSASREDVRQRRRARMRSQSGMRGLPGRAMGAAARVLPALGRIGGVLSALSVVSQVVDTYRNAKTKGEKAEGYGGAAGSFAGALAGGKLGAVAGAFAGPLGAAVGLVLGGAIGGAAGNAGGAAAAKVIWGGDAPSSKQSPGVADPSLVRAIDRATQIPGVGAPSLASAPALSLQPASGRPVSKTSSDDGLTGFRAARPAWLDSAVQRPEGKSAAPAPMQQLTFSPSISVTVQGDIKDSKQIATELMPHLRRLFEQAQAQMRRAALHDGVHF